MYDYWIDLLTYLKLDQKLIFAIGDKEGFFFEEYKQPQTE
jgi:hypothetical protein